MFKPLSLVFLVAIAAPAFAQAPSAQSAPAAKAANPNDKIICEREEEIGSRLGGKKVCKTAQEWQLERQQQRETIEKVQQQTTSTGVPAG